MPPPGEDWAAPLLPTGVDPSTRDDARESPSRLPPRDSATPKGSAPGIDSDLGSSPVRRDRGDDAVLYQDLPWDFCGPRIGVAGLGGAAVPTIPSDAPVDAIADHAEYDRGRDLVTLTGAVEFTRGDQILRADRSTYDRRSEGVEAEGDVYFEYTGARLSADSGRYSLQTKEGELENVGFRLSGNANLRGTAGHAELLAGDRTRYRDVIYTTCPPGRSDWSLRASDLLLDHADGMGTARHARIRLAGVPVLYSPYLRFPIDDRRRSGFLIPSFGTSNLNGTEITIPYYWNIAPNYDATFYPRIMSSRGLMLGAQFRHLASFQRLEVNGEVIPNDSKSEEEKTRGAIRIEQTGTFGRRWSSMVDYSAVTDDGYLADFGNRLDLTSLRNLPQRGDLRYAGDGYWWLARVQDFQTVDPAIPERSRPYAQMPHVELNLGPFRPARLADLSLEAYYDYFDHSAKVHGSRVVALPSVQMPLRRSFGHFIPRARLYYTGYELSDVAPGVASQQSHLIPSLDLDGKLIFERDTSWFGSSVLQTLEPRLYYVLTTYEDQSDTPLFDTTELDFSFASLFRPNRFTGYDRVGDENRLTLALTSRTLDSRDGRELFRASVGQIQYFREREVQLRGGAPGEDPSSSVAGELAASLDQDWSARATLQWNPHESESPWEKRVLQLRYAPDDKRVMNLAYRYNLGQTEAQRYEDTDLSFHFPVTSQVGLVGRWLYSWLNNETVDAFAGIEFGRCCWKLRVVGRHLKTPTQEEGNTSVMVQLELAGLGALGSSIDKLLEQGIYGYRSD
jgi:LPS-assembly protein